MLAEKILMRTFQGKYEKIKLGLMDDTYKKTRVIFVLGNIMLLCRRNVDFSCETKLDNYKNKYYV